MKCIHCNQEHPDDFMFCPKTGAKIEPQYKACTNKECRDFGKYILPLEAKFCPRCGKEIEGQKGSGKKEETNKANGKKKESNGYINGHEYVDLGLPSGLKWATCNVGANSPEEYGDYYAWGEVDTKSTYGNSIYKFSNGVLWESFTFKKFEDLGAISSTRYDVARTNWGGSWRLPKITELEELKNKCTWEWITQNDKKGFKVTGPNSNSIFIPAAGRRNGSSLYRVGDYGYYWSSTTYGYDDDRAYYLGFYDGNEYVNWLNNRNNGLTVRPITE